MIQREDSIFVYILRYIIFIVIKVINLTISYAVGWINFRHNNFLNFKFPIIKSNFSVEIAKDDYFLLRKGVKPFI